jgi:Capsule assembly protein Wzi
MRWVHLVERFIRVKNFAAVAACLLTVVTASVAMASVNLPLHHWAYEAIERLTAMGIIDRAMVVAKPYSRKQAAKYVARALERIRSNDVTADGREVVAEPLLQRLMTELRPELMDIGSVFRKRTDRGSPVRYGGQVQTEVDAFSLGGNQNFRLRENRGGEYYTNNVQNQTDVRGWLEIGDWAAFMVQPKFISITDALARGPTEGPLSQFNNQYVYLREASAKLTFWNVALEFGRGTQWWGPGYHGSLLLTDHAFPLDMIKLGSDETFRLPWVLRELGDWKINTFLARLEGQQTFSHEQIFGLRISYVPIRWLELGFTRLTQYGGQGSGTSFPRTIGDCYKDPPNQGGTAQCNEQAMLDGRAHIPPISYLVPFPGGMQLYGELGSEDKWSQFPVPSRGAYLAGLYIPQLVAGDTTDLRIEWADTDLARRKSGFAGVWYNNGTYSNGMRQYGFPLGHHMGTDGLDFFVRSTRYVTESWQIGSNLNYQERARGVSTHERKYEFASDLTWWYSTYTRFSFGYTYQRIYNPGQITSVVPFNETFAPGVVANNNLFWTSMTMTF